MTELIGINWATVLQSIGIGGVFVVAIWFGFKGFVIMTDKLSENTQVVAQNTQAFMSLSRVMEQASAREMAFQQDMMRLSEDTNRKVTELHDKEFLGVRR